MVAQSSEHESQDFDIGKFLNSYDCLKAQMDDLNEVLQATNLVRRWDIPSLSFLCCLFTITLCISFPEFLFAFCLSPIPLVLLVTYIKSLGESKQLRHIVVMAVEKGDEELLKRKQEMVERSRRDVKRFIKVLCEIHNYMDMVYGKVSYVQRLFLWEDPQLTKRFLGSTFALMVLLSFLPFSLIFLASFLYIILNNDEFKKVIAENTAILKLAGLEGIYYLEEDHKDTEWYDASSVVESDASSFEDDELTNSSEDSEEFEEIDINQSMGKRSKSFVSHLNEYRKRRQEFKKGNCAACDVAFSSLLTRRRYCRRCGDKFCSKCCRHYVKKAALGATAPGSRDKRVVVCNACYGKLRVAKAPD
ncbi:protrudin-like isoform X1 [Dendronephthya gigantea]|uniref:protrudin-like isoform X1 n=1 Tax=Dendronephthya gigantea TaxID=151771 RepID=UPI00106DBDCA|nr:protrudin-like isoform X1 [Dendronephthya gigantea]